jgi:hypothetical protein
MLVELAGVPDEGATEGLECLCKALAEGGGAEGDASIWAPHPSPFLTTLVEAFTDNGLKVSAAMAAEALNWLTGKMYSAKFTGSPNPGPFPWSAADLPAVHAWLAGKTPAEMNFADWSMLCDYIVSVHASQRFVASHAGWMAARAVTMGKLQAALPALSAAAAENALASLPSTVEQALASFAFTPAQRAAMQFAQAHCADAITGATAALRSGVKQAVLQEMAQPHVPGVASHSLQTRLTDAFGKFNRDWRRIAVTEAGEAKNQGFIASLPPRAKVRRLERYAGACSFCRRIDGRVFTVVAADAKDKNGQTQVWPGKSNIGRSASPTKIVNGSAAPRSDDELWWPAAGLQHPHCRGTWILQTAAAADPGQSADAGDADWAAWLSAIGLA